MENAYYKNIGGAPLSGLATALVFGLIAAFVLGAAYAAAVWFGPFIYLNILMAVLFGYLLGFFLGKGAIKGRVRSVGAVLLLALIVTLAAEYVQWAAHITLFANAGTSANFGSGKNAFAVVSTSFDLDSFFYALTHPNDMFLMAQAIANEGFWSFDKHTPTGMELWAIWGIEVLIIIAFTMIGAHKQIDRPYSDSADCWMDKQDLPSVLEYVENPKEFVQQLENKDYSAIFNAAPMAENKTLSRVKFTLYSRPGDAYAYLCATNIKMVRKKMKRANIMKFLRLEQGVAQRIAQHLGASLKAQSDPKA